MSRTVFCNGIIPMTPEKDLNSSDKILPQGTPNKDQNTDQNQIKNQEDETGLNSDNSFKVPTLISPLDSPAWPAFEAEDLARRHSLSLLNRTPPEGSLAAQLLDPSLSLVPRSLISNIKDITASLSDFNSCISSTSDNSESESKESFKDLPTVGIKKRKRKKSPGKKELIKKADMKVTPDKAPTNI